MGFSEKIKFEVRKKSNFRCCICGKLFIEIHHIIPEFENGENTIENAAPLCAYCHDIYGGNPQKRKQIKQMRNHWYVQMEDRRNKIINAINLNNIIISEYVPENIGEIGIKGTAIYHNIFSYEGFEKSAKILIELIRKAQKDKPECERYLFLDIEGHLNKKEAFDHDMFELQRHFILGFLMPFLTEAHLPLISIKNTNSQKNDFPDKIDIFSSEKEAIKFTEKNGYTKVYSADKDNYLN